MLLALAGTVVALVVLVAAAPQPTSHSNSILLSKRSVLSNKDNTVKFASLAAHISSVKTKFGRDPHISKKSTGLEIPTIERHKKRDDSAPLEPAPRDSYWYANISVGTPPRQFSALVDTGSSDLILPSSSCHTNCDGHKLWDPASSSTAVDVHKEAEIAYGNGSVSVELEKYTDNVSIAGFTASKQAIGAALKYDPTMTPPHLISDGILGMGYESLSTLNASSLIFTLVDQGKLHEPMFSVRLSDLGGQLDIGGVNSKSYQGDFAYANVTKQGYWQVTTDNIQGNGVTILTNIVSSIDTSTTGVIGNRSEVAKLHRSLNGTLIPSLKGPDFYTYPCDSFPNISFTLGGVTFPMSKDTQNFGPVSNDTSICLSNICGEDLGRDIWVMGAALLRNFYVNFDIGKSRVGFAKLADLA